MYTVLVSGASGIVGYGILRCLKDANCRTLGTTIYDISPANCFSDVLEIVPKTSEDGYVDHLVGLINEYKVDMIIPGIEEDMIVWNDNRRTLSKTGAFLLLNREFLINSCVDKWKFFEILREHNVSCRIDTSIDADYKKYNAPFILKPRRGYGSKGVVTIESYEQFKHYEKRIGKELIMQEMVGSDDEEYTVSAFFDYDSEVKNMIAIKKRLSRSGYTEIAEIVDAGSFEKNVFDLAKIFNPVGPTNFQFRKDHRGWKLLEINPRISSATSIRKAFGFNESKMSVDYFLGNKTIDPCIIQKGTAIRYIEDYII